MPLSSVINWLYIQLLILSYKKDDRNFTGSKITIIKMPCELSQYEARVVSRSF